jgi:hypothetical protein
MPIASILTRQTATRLPAEKLGDSIARILPRALQMTNSERAVQCIMVLAYNFGIDIAFQHFNTYYLNTDREIGIAWLIESRAFPGTLYHDLFNLISGEA